MNIIYLLDEDISTESGVVKKIKSQISEWERYNIKIKVVSLKSNSLTSAINEGKVIDKYRGDISFLNKFIKHYKSIRKLDEYLETIENIDLIYTRFIRYSPNLISTLKKHSPYIIELNTNDIEEFKLGGKLSYYLNFLTRNFFFNSANGFISVSNELANHKNFTKFRKPTIVIGNGYNFRNAIINTQKFIKVKKFVFIGSPNQPWHGIDKIIVLARLLKEYEFHIIGYDHKTLSKQFALSENIITYGYLSQEESDKIISNCHIGISTLALHRKNMIEASPLKSRHYLANGLPIILAYEDTDLKENEYILNIGNYENNVIDSVDKILHFIEKINLLDPMKIIQESKKILSYENKEIDRINYFKSIIND